MFSLLFICLFVNSNHQLLKRGNVYEPQTRYLSVCQQDYSKSYGQIFMKLGGWMRVRHEAMTNRLGLDFETEPDQDMDLGPSFFHFSSIKRYAF